MKKVRPFSTFLSAFNHSPILNPMWLMGRVSFWFDPIIGTIGGALIGGLSDIFGGRSASKAREKEVAAQNAANLEAVRLQNRYDAEAAEKANRMAILQNLWNGGYFGGHEADLNYGRTKLQRGRANYFGLAPHKEFDEMQFLENSSRYADDPYMMSIDRDKGDMRSFLDLLGIDIGPQKQDPLKRDDYLSEWRRVREKGDPRDFEQWVEDHENPTPNSQNALPRYDYNLNPNTGAV